MWCRRATVPRWPRCAAGPTSTSWLCTRRRSCTSTTCGARSMPAVTCCATSRSAGMATRRRRCATSPTPQVSSTSSTSRPGTTRLAGACVDALADDVIGDARARGVHDAPVDLARAPAQRTGGSSTRRPVGDGCAPSARTRSISPAGPSARSPRSAARSVFATTERPDADGKVRHCTGDDGFVLVLRTDRGVSIVMDSTASAPVGLPLSTLVVGSPACSRRSGTGSSSVRKRVSRN